MRQRRGEYAAMEAEIVKKIADGLLSRQWRMATAESCTGGMVAAACTAIPGSSQWFAGGLVTYAIPWKERYLGVSSQTIMQHGVVSAQTAQEMATGCCRHCGVNAAVAVTGIAGPGGAEPGNPVGTVFIAAIAGGKTPLVRRFEFPGCRQAVREAATAAALSLLLEALRSDGGDGHPADGGRHSNNIK